MVKCIRKLVRSLRAIETMSECEGLIGGGARGERHERQGARRLAVNILLADRSSEQSR